MENLAGQARLQTILTEMNREGNFPISVLTDSQGLGITSAAGAHMDPDRHSAVVGHIQKAALQVTRHIGMDATDEISLNDVNHQRLICRPFKIGNQELILAIIVTDKEQSYRRLTNQAIAKIKSVWSQHWN
jgi:predicted regulator of Ras-like GTPase activity (Roadblock/LC7/MglB family)